MDQAKRNAQKLIRSKRICKHPNLLFKKWLLEWKLEADKKNSNMKHNFQRALKSLEKFPLPIYTGKDCLVLSNFGEKICQQLDKKLESHIEENGPINWKEYIQIKEVKRKGQKLIRSKVLSTPMEKEKKKKVNRVDLPTSLSPKNQNKAAKTVRNKEYIPSYRSGSYALLLGLLMASKKHDYPGYLKKQELIDASQDLADVSFSVPPTGSHYTAFSSMSTLIKKGLALKMGNPARYSLTEAGKDLANRLLPENANSCLSTIKSSSSLRSIECDTMMEEKSQTKTRSLQTQGIIHDISDSDSEGDSSCLSTAFRNKSSTDSLDKASNLSKNPQDNIVVIDKDNEKVFSDEVNYFESESFIEPEEISLLSEDEIVLDRVDKNLDSLSKNNSTGFQFTFIDTDGLETNRKNNAKVRVDEENGSLEFLIKCKLVDLISSCLSYTFDDLRDAPPAYTYAYLKDINCPECSSGFETPVIQTLQSCSKSFPKKPAEVIREKELKRLQGNLPVSSGTGTSVGEPGRKRTKLSAESETSTPNSNNFSKISSTLLNSMTIEEPISSTRLSRILFSLQPRKFKVILCVDNMEVTGGFSNGKKSTKDIIIHELEKNKINISIRKLNVGDFLWLCEEITENTKEKQELVLPFIVERKRMDDLASSIRDGRFKEQKFRLKQSGLSRPIYLVEEVGSGNLSLPLSSCLQACTNTQVNDNFFVKFVADQRESAAYLTIMTRYLESKLQYKTINAVRREDLCETFDISSPSIDALIFKDFYSSSMKNRSLTVQEMLVKHLIQLFGLSVDKAAVIVQKYPTPYALLDSIENSPTSQKEELLSSLRCPASGQKISSSISSNLVRLYSWKDLN